MAIQHLGPCLSSLWVAAIKYVLMQSRRLPRGGRPGGSRADGSEECGNRDGAKVARPTLVCGSGFSEGVGRGWGGVGCERLKESKAPRYVWMIATLLRLVDRFVHVYMRACVRTCGKCNPFLARMLARKLACTHVHIF